MSEGTTTFEIAKDGVGGLVVGYDESEPSRDAVAFAAGVARRNHARLVVASISVVPVITSMAAISVPVASPAATEPDIMEGLADLGITAEFRQSIGDVATELERIAEETRADAIVVGRSQSRLHAYAGSVTSRLIRQARRPVVVVP